MMEPARVRWQRRAISIPTMLAATTIGFFGFPVLAPVAVVADLIRLRLRLPALRVYLFCLQYLFNDSVEIVAAPLLWLMAGFGRRLDSPSSIRRHERLQWWSLRLLTARASQLLGLRVELDADHRRSMTPGPVIVIGRHVSLFDASLPGLLYQQLDFRVRGVIMAEMLADPGFDLIYGRTGSVFIPRDRGPEAVAAIETMAADADDQTAFVIFPEGRLFHPKVAERAMTRLAESDPERAERLAGRTATVPPRPGGLLAILNAVPTADVVIVQHEGLDRFQKLADVVSLVPVNDAVSISVRRIARADIPEDDDGRIRWLDQVWLDLDRDLQAS